MSKATVVASADPAQRTASDWLLLVGLGLIWGTAFAFTKVALVGFGPLTVAAGRIGVAALVLYSSARMVGMNQRLPPRYWGYAFAIAVLGNALPFLLIAWGQQRVDSGLAGLLMAIMPLVTLMLAHYFTEDDRLSPQKAVGFVCGFVGVLVLIGPDALGDFGQRDAFWSQLAILCAAVSYAVAAILARRMPKVPVLLSASSVLLVASLILLPAALWFEQPWTEPPQVPSALALVWLGLVPTALATLMYFRIVQRAGASFLSQINFLIPVTALLTGILVMGEPAEARFFMALAIILLGLLIAQSRGRAVGAESSLPR